MRTNSQIVDSIDFFQHELCGRQSQWHKALILKYFLFNVHVHANIARIATSVLGRSLLKGVILKASD